jgi:hypothetical protein
MSDMRTRMRVIYSNSFIPCMVIRGVVTDAPRFLGPRVLDHSNYGKYGLFIIIGALVHPDLRTVRDPDAQSSDNHAITSTIRTFHNWSGRGHADREADACQSRITIHGITELLLAIDNADARTRIRRSCYARCFPIVLCTFLHAIYFSVTFYYLHMYGQRYLEVYKYCYVKSPHRCQRHHYPFLQE